MENEHVQHIPAEVIEQILLDLPIKSLVRSSAVSKSWNLMIFRREFVKRYRGRELIVLRAYSDDDDEKALAMAIPLCSISSDDPMDKATPFTRPIKAEADTYVNASCGDMWCLEFQNSLLLYNPSMQTYRKLPTPSVTVFVYGLGYDSAANDYKSIKIHRDNYVKTELYSLTGDCWRTIKSPPQYPYKSIFLSSKGVFVSGRVHWLVDLRHIINGGFGLTILSFDLSKDKYGQVKLPQLPKPIFMIVFGGKLRVYLNYGCHTRLLVWVMEDYESKSWTKELEINYAHIHPLCFSNLKPFYFYDCGNVIKAVTSSTNMQKVYKKKKMALQLL